MLYSLYLKITNKETKTSITSNKNDLKLIFKNTFIFNQLSRATTKFKKKKKKCIHFFQFKRRIYIIKDETWRLNWVIIRDKIYESTRETRRNKNTLEAKQI